MVQIVWQIIALLAYVQPTVYAQRSGSDRGNVFVGCTSLPPPLSLIGTKYAESATTTYSDGQACSNACSSIDGSSFPYTPPTLSYYSQGDKTCVCSRKFPSLYSRGNQGGCSENAYEIYVLGTTFTQYQTYPCRRFFNPNAFTYPFNDINACFAQCAGFTLAAFLPAGTTYGCACSNNLQANGFGGGDTPFTCDDQTPRIYIHSAEAQVSQLSRRRLLEQRRAAVPELCPVGLTACRIQGALENYECLETDSELESCGGCLFGQYDANNGTAGVDCTSLSGRSGAYSCVKGTCVSN